MDETSRRLVAMLRGAAVRLRQAGLPDGPAGEMERLAKQVQDERYIVTVVGQMNVGKSTFVNALLGRDLAKVGTTETTATINYFSYGRPANLERPVRCHWRGGSTTYEGREFLDALQGNDLQTLRRAEGIDHLEYRLEHPFLERVTLVDTPGTNAVVKEHQDATAQFFELYSQLRERHNKETQSLGMKADAVIYLTGAVANISDRAFLEEFRETTGGRSSSLNAIGVISKIEVHPEVMAHRHELARDIANQMKHELNGVVPVGAGVRRALYRMSENRPSSLGQLIQMLRNIPAKRLQSMLTMSKKFLEREYEDCPVGAEERRGSVGEMPWAVFTTIARVAADPTLSTEGVAKRLNEISNFDSLEQILHEHFIERGHILRCYRIMRDAQHVLNEVKVTHLPQRRMEIHGERGRLDRFVGFIRQAAGDDETAAELEDFVRAHLGARKRISELEELHQELDGELSALFHQLAEYDRDFEALQMLARSDDVFTEEELGELGPC